MAENIIALMLPEYDDAGSPITAKDWTTGMMYDDEAIGMQIKEMGSFVDFFSDEECRMVYDSRNVQAYLFVADTFPDYYPSRRSQLRSIFRSFEVQDWRMNRKSSENDEYSICHEMVRDEIRTEIAARKKPMSSDSYIIATDVFGNEARSWELENGDTACNVECLPLSILHVFAWLSKHHKPLRKYEWNEKHGENGKGAHPGNKGDEVSLLLCSIEHARELLPKAIGEKMYDYLYCFDADYGKYMEYPAGCKYMRLPSGATVREYHSYHIDNDNRVPKRVARKLEILRTLSQKQ